VLLLDDIWTTGGRIQSLAHVLKAAGASAVVAVVIGRVVNHDYRPSRTLLKRVANTHFNLNRCAASSCRE
jgi:phosphoribosylpyrophosphate synthetase